MRIPRVLLLDPERNGLYAASAVALSLFVFAYSTLFGQVSILAYYALWLPLMLLAPQAVLARWRDLVLPGGFVALLIASTLWSNAPSATLRGSIQFATHVLCVLVAARVVNMRSLTRGVLFGTSLVILYSLLFGYSAYDVMDGSYTFVGAFGSKNQLGLYCALGILFALISLLTQREHLLTRAAVAAIVPICAVTLMASRSATSMIALAVAVTALVGLVAVLRFGPVLRGFILLLLLPVGALLALAAQQMGAVEAVLQVFGKDATLTGRTYLWSEGLSTFAQYPVAGVGYMAYWVHGFENAERLWDEFYITARTGFHFHNTVIEALVELGAVGTALLLLLAGSLLFRLLHQVAIHRDTIAACHLALLSMMLVRSMSEVDILYPYTVGAFLFFYSAIVSTNRARARSAAAGAPWFAPRSPAASPLPA